MPVSVSVTSLVASTVIVDVAVFGLPIAIKRLSRKPGCYQLLDSLMYFDIGVRPVVFRLHLSRFRRRRLM